MNYDFGYPYEQVIEIYIRGNVDEGQPGYVSPEDDIYLKDIQTKIHEEIKRNVWEGKKIHCWDILRSEINGPDSSGYENTLTITVGFHKNVHPSYDEPTPRWTRFIEMVEEFSNNK